MTIDMKSPRLDALHPLNADIGSTGSWLDPCKGIYWVVSPGVFNPTW